MRQCGCSEDDMKILLAKKFLIAFETGVIVIKHWKINNYLRNDRYTETKYADEKKQLKTDENGAYKLVGIPGGIPRLDKNRLDKNSIDNIIVIDEQKNEEEQQPQQQKSKKFVKPSIDEIKNYCSERKNNIDANYFFDYYESKGWQIGKNTMKDWKAAVRTWERKNFNKDGEQNAGITADVRKNPNESKYSRANGWF